MMLIASASGGAFFPPGSFFGPSCTPAALRQCAGVSRESVRFHDLSNIIVNQMMKQMHLIHVFAKTAVAVVEKEVTIGLLTGLDSKDGARKRHWRANVAEKRSQTHVLLISEAKVYLVGVTEERNDPKNEGYSDKSVSDIFIITSKVEANHEQDGAPSDLFNRISL